MSHTNRPDAAGTDWTHLLSDPDLVRHVGKLLQAYREAPPDQRDQVLLATMREIKAQAFASKAPKLSPQVETKAPAGPVPVSAVPPFKPDLYTPNVGDDRRHYPRLKCFVAVELRVDDSPLPVWGNLCNTSVGGCLVETASSVKSGSKVEIGLWLSSGKIWVKGFALNGIVTHTGRTNALRVRFSSMEPNERESLRQFLKYVQDSACSARSESSYLNLLK